jgi:hypothetical protein
VTNLGIASAKQLRLPLAPPEDEARVGLWRMDAPVCLPHLLERALERSNMFRALRRVRRNQGGPGIDGMTVDELPSPCPRCHPLRLGGTGTAAFAVSTARSPGSGVAFVES